MTIHPVPRLAAALLRACADPERRDAQLGDLAEEHADRAAHDRRGADRWYWRQALLSLAPNLRQRARRFHRAHRPTPGEGLMRTFLQDLKLTARAARSDVGFTLVIVLTVALGIGANTTIFSVVHGLILDPFPFPEPDRIVGIGTAYPRMGADLGFFENMSPAEYEDIRDETRTLEDVVAWDMGNRQIAGDGPPENVFTAFWWGDALRTMQMEAHLGRGFSDDEIESRAAVALLGYDIWRNRFGADSSLVGQSILVNDYPHTVVGVLPEGVDIYGTDLWTLMAIGPERYDRNRRQFQVMARIRDGSTLEEVNTELTQIAARVDQDHRAEFEEYEGWSMRAMRWSEVSSNVFRTAVFVLMGAVVFVLLLVCANTANLLLARSQTRRREMAVRTALGAGRGRLIGQLLTESVALAAAGAILGVALAHLGVHGIMGGVSAVGFNPAGDVEVNGPVLLFTAGVAVVAGIAFGIAPALQASGARIAGTLQVEGMATTAGVSRQRLQRTFVGVEVALAFILLAGGGLLVNSFVRVHRVDPGFDAANVLTMRVTLPREEYSGPAVTAFFRELADRLERIPGVREAGAGTQFPPISFSFRQVFFDGAEADAEATLPTTLATAVTRGYFEALGIPLLRGRTFNDQDAAGTPNVVVVNEEVARRYFAGQDPIGRRMKLGSADADTPWWEIVGVVGSTHNRGLSRDAFPEVFAVHEQAGGVQNQLFLLLSTDVDPHSLVPAVRNEVLAMDSDQPVYAIQTVEEAFGQSMASMRSATFLLSLLGAFALLIAAVGIYSVVSFTVSERTREIGLRVALGADSGRVRRLVVRQALLPVLVGAAFGTAGALVLAGFLQDLLFEVGGRDPVTMGAIALVLVSAALVASWVPAWRASRMDPVEALRVD